MTKNRVDILVQQIKNISPKADHYKDSGYLIEIDNDSLEIIYKDQRYTVKVVEEDGSFYWHLKPYNNSYYRTIIDSTGNHFDMVLFAIKENEELYGKE